MNMDQFSENDLPPMNHNPKRPVRWDRNDSILQEQFVFQLNNRFKLTFEYIAITCLIAFIFIISLITDQFSLFVLALLVAPTLTPIFSFSFGISLGSLRLIKYAVLTLFVGGGIIFAVGLFAGFIANQLTVNKNATWLIFTQFSWGAIILILAGNLFALTIFIRNPLQSMNVTNVALAYGFYLPLVSAGFLLTSGEFVQFQAAILTFFWQYFLAIISGSILLLVFGVRQKGFKVLIPIGVILASLLTVLLIKTFFIGNGNPKINDDPIAILTTVTPSKTQEISNTKTPLPTLIILESIPTEEVIVPRITLPPSQTPTITLTPLPTPVWAQIQAVESNGANVRSEPGYKGKIIKSILNGTLVEVLPEVEVVDGSTWVHIRMQDQSEGWIVRSLLVSSTPAADW